MGYIFRLSSKGDNTLEDWATSMKYGKQQLDSIIDPNDKSKDRQITSIPSPFARIDLVKTAFAEVSKKDANGKHVSMEGDTIYHKLVSDSLDVGEIFFEINKLKNKFEIIPWDVKSDLDSLLNDQNIEHLQLGETYKMFMDRDSDMYNFNVMQRIYLLNYVGEGADDSMNIVGATSPSTLFFCSANNLSFVSKNVVLSGNDRPFDADLRPLHKRDVEYHKYMWALHYVTDFNRKFPEMYSYIEGSYSMSDQGRKGELDKIKDDVYLTKLKSIPVQGNTGFNVEVCDCQLYSKPESVSQISSSDFIIRSNRYSGGQLPLVLPISTNNTKGLLYVNEQWNDNNKAPYYDTHPLNQRTLPFDGSKYPYLTVGDFLPDWLVKIPQGMTTLCMESFFDGNFDGNQDTNGNGNKTKDNDARKYGTYMLPLTDLFFKFFDTDQLINGIDGSKMLEMQKLAGGIRVILRIPIKKGYIEYQRTYYDKQEPNKNENKGAIKIYSFAFAIMPVVRFDDESLASYNLGLVHEYEDVKYDVKVMKNGNSLDCEQFIRNKERNNYQICHSIVVEKSNIDYIRISCGENISGVILPKFKSQRSGCGNYSFSVDFGTSNTHIEYSVDGGKVKELDVSLEDAQIRYFTYNKPGCQLVFDKEFEPLELGNSCKYDFPMRTALNVANNTDWTKAVPILNGNIAFTYEKFLTDSYNHIVSDLKWSNDNNKEAMVRCYIESIMVLLRNKVLYNGGDLKNTRIVWFYPISMAKWRRKLFGNVWKDAYKKYFGDGNNISPMTESVAPCEYFKNTENNASSSNIVTIDIGGGTTDVFISDGGNGLITSFRFAANSIFGTPYSDSNACQNGIVRQFKDEIMSIVNEPDLKNIYEKLNESNNSVNIASFLFSLSRNIKDKRLVDSVDFVKRLSLDETQKIVFVIFYVAIIYHVAHIMKTKKLPMPRIIAFSGNGSKVLYVIDDTSLEKLTKIVFQKVFEQQYNSDGLKVKRSEQPKESTCKGGLICKAIPKEDDVDKCKVFLKSATMDCFITKEKYRDIDENYKKSVVEQVKKFMNFIFDLDDEISFKNYLGIDRESVKIAKDVCYKDLLTFVDKGLSLKQADVDNDDIVEETLFFYPINGMLSALSDAIATNQNK